MVQETKREDLKNAPVGVFDSGVGGLTVMKEIMHQIPNEKIIYFGDTARVPYGNKSKDTVLRFSRQIVRFLKTQEVKAIVIACNTASAYALPDIEKEIDIPIIGVVRPGAKVAAQVTQNGKVGVIATEGTINSHIYADYIKKINAQATVIGKACPLFVPLAEEGLWEDPVTDEIARRYLAELIDIGIDTLILGCTHYPLIREVIQKHLPGVFVYDGGFGTAKQTKRRLEERGLLSDRESGGKVEIFNSRNTEEILELSRRLLNM